FAALTMNADLGLSQTAYGFGAGIFFIAYFIFEVPSNLLLERFGARKWIARIMLSWGILSGMMAFRSEEHTSELQSHRDLHSFPTDALPIFIFEVPSNLLLERFGARKWIARIMLSWGILSGMMAFFPPIPRATGSGKRKVFY